jgi:hypothetical protein
VSFDLTGLQLAEFEKLMEKVQGRRSKQEVLLLALAALSEHGQSPRRASPPGQLVVHRCDVCRQTNVPRSALLPDQEWPLIFVNCVMSRQKCRHQNQTTSRERCRTRIAATPSPASRSSPASSIHVAPCDSIVGM